MFIISHLRKLKRSPRIVKSYRSGVRVYQSLFVLVFVISANYRVFGQDLFYGNAGFGLDTNTNFQIEFLQMQWMNIGGSHLGVGFSVARFVVALDNSEDLLSVDCYAPVTFSYFIKGQQLTVYDKIREKDWVKRYFVTYVGATGAFWGKADFFENSGKHHLNFVDLYAAANIPIEGSINFEVRIGNVVSNIHGYRGPYISAYLGIGSVEAHPIR